MKNIFIIDDHPLTISAYKSLLADEFGNNVEVIAAHNGNEIIAKSKLQIATNKVIDLAIIDYSIPASDTGNIKNGMDAATYITTHFKNCKIVFLTMHNEPLLLQNLHLKFKPEGIISKNDIDSDSFPKIIRDIIEGGFYRSETMVEALKVMMSKNLNFDEIDSQILLLIANKVKSKDLINYINLSQSAIEKRKHKIKYQLIGDKGSDKELISVAKAYKLI
jgi:DNA-binding NarL/FixJ family response regulator